MTIGELVRQGRRTLGLNQVELARRAGLTQNYISKLETGQIDLPQRGTLDVLATVLPYTVADFYRAAGVLETKAADDERQPVPAIYDTALPSTPEPSDAEVIAFAESIADPAIRADLQEFRDTLPDAAYLRVCRRFYRILVPAGRAVLAAERP